MGVQPGKDTSMYLLPLGLSLILGIVLLGNAKKFEEKQAEKRAANQTPDYAEKYPILERLLEGFPESYVLLVCVLLFRYQSGLLSGLLKLPWGTLRSVSILAILLLPAFKRFPKQNLYLGLGMLGYALNSLRIVLQIPFDARCGRIFLRLCKACGSRSVQ